MIYMQMWTKLVYDMYEVSLLHRTCNPIDQINAIFFQTLFEFLRYKSGIVVSLVYCISTKYCIINYDNKSFSLDAWITQIWDIIQSSLL